MFNDDLNLEVPPAFVLSEISADADPLDLADGGLLVHDGRQQAILSDRAVAGAIRTYELTHLAGQQIRETMLRGGGTLFGTWSPTGEDYTPFPPPVPEQAQPPVQAQPPELPRQVRLRGGEPMELE